MRNPKVKFIGGGLIIVAALTWLGVAGFQESKAYYITVNEFRHSESSFHGKNVKVAGDVVEGSIDRKHNQLEFVIAHEGESLKVQYVGKALVPDTFKDGAKAVVEGQLGQDGTFQAKHIEAKCSSKYEAEYEKKAKPVDLRKVTS